MATVCSVIQENKDLDTKQIVINVKNWSAEKANKFNQKQIESAVIKLEEKSLIQKNLMGYYNLKNGI